MTLTEKIAQLIDEKGPRYTEISDKIWAFAETRFEEVQSANLLCETLENEGFQVERGVANLETGFIGTFGSGKPVIAILGEYDALAGLSQQAGSSEHNPIIANGNGHGCGHNLLGVGALAGAIAVKDYIQEQGLTGTVKYYGCPAEESGYGKSFLARDGYFKDVDIALSWHPGTANAVWHARANAVINATFTFKGRSSHAAASPHLGRSALDGVELMNVGVNYLREHMVDEARIHYAITNTGGLAPNVVQAEAEVTYLIRAPKPEQVRDLYRRVLNCANGAALMTETSVDARIVGSCHSLVPNRTLETIMHQHLQDLGSSTVTEEDLRFAKEIYDTFSDEEKALVVAQVGKEVAQQLAEKPLLRTVVPLANEPVFLGGSTDVADVSWNVPTAQCTTATYAFGTPFHTWQVVAQGKTAYAHQATLLAGKAIACTAISALENPTLIEEAKAELQQRLDGETYEALIPKDLVPPTVVEAKIL
ncbi:M20 family metallopeptidase [Lysinibacillus piscis]|uniref:p-aminobenzoyl-glutamate hydrolase subunit B n=1 Tax=Lysinibacillus piscis TaxID=2518931 RepID=A0ABQ5NJC9_9BACI|nr:M20 family metallopeptidase [Lysinibacillus sp. KH24]GLC88385.1 p-aminobenzoyl-glutamate hydrolase subunit B [Lysinibacillus sp. KH24]